MTVVLALFPEYRGTRLGVSKDGRVLTGFAATGEDPFAKGEELAGGAPSIVVVPAGMREHPWHPLTRLQSDAERYRAERGIAVLVVRPMAADLVSEARLSGYKDYDRRGVFCSVPQRAAFQKAVEVLGVSAADARLITVYLGDEAAVSAHRGPRVIDTSDPVACEGPFGLTSMGTPPATAFVSFVAQQGGDRSPGAAAELRVTLKEGSGVFAYAGVSDLDSLSRALAEGREGAVKGVAGMAYQVAKEIGREAAALKGRVDAVVLCGPGASLSPLISSVINRVGKWAKVIAFQEDLAIPFLLREGNAALSSKQET